MSPKWAWTVIIHIKLFASARFQAAVDIYLSGVWSCFNVLQKEPAFHPRCDRCSLRRSACRAWTDARSYISICDSYTVQEIICNTIPVSVSVERWDTVACSIQAALCVCIVLNCERFQLSSQAGEMKMNEGEEFFSWCFSFFFSFTSHCLDHLSFIALSLLRLKT